MKQNELNTGSFDRNTLKNIRDVKIDLSLPREERIRSYVSQIGNPYCYIDDGIVVSVGFAETDVSLQDRLKTYLNGIA